MKMVYILCWSWILSSLGANALAQENNDQLALESLVYFGRPLGENMEGLSVQERKQALERGYQSIENLNEKLVQMFEQNIEAINEIDHFASLLYALSMRTDLTVDQIHRLTAPLESPAYKDDMLGRQRVYLARGILAILRHYPGEENRLLARKFLLDSDLTVVIKAIETLSFIGNSDDLVAAYNQVEKRRGETSGSYYDVYREEMIGKYNDFARRLSRPTLKQSRLLTSEEIRQLQQTPKNQQESLIRSFLSTSEEAPKAPVSITPSENFGVTKADIVASGYSEVIVIVVVSIASIALLFLVLRNKVSQ